MDYDNIIKVINPTLTKIGLNKKNLNSKTTWFYQNEEWTGTNHWFIKTDLIPKFLKKIEPNSKMPKIDRLLPMINEAKSELKITSTVRIPSTYPETPRVQLSGLNNLIEVNAYYLTTILKGLHTNAINTFSLWAEEPKSNIFFTLAENKNQNGILACVMPLI